MQKPQKQAYFLTESLKTSAFSCGLRGKTAFFQWTHLYKLRNGFEGST
jgi:hypothetical protein